MTHRSENSIPLTITHQPVTHITGLLAALAGFNDVALFRMPFLPEYSRQPLVAAGETIWTDAVSGLGENATLIVVGDVEQLVHFHTSVANAAHYHLWIVIKREPTLEAFGMTRLPQQHFGALVYTRYAGQLKHTKTRIAYTYCPQCNRTTKDYGGKKHTYDSYGTLISDVWRDIAIDPTGDITPVIERFADLFGIAEYEELRVFDLMTLPTKPHTIGTAAIDKASGPMLDSQLYNGDSLEHLRALPANSVDFAFVDPPYNLKKNYLGYTDDLAIARYFEWCDEWISEVARVLRPGGTFALLNIPIRSIRHFLHLETVLTFQNWLVWDALSFPVRLIMPAHYTILCFSKGPSRPLPGLTGADDLSDIPRIHPAFQTLAPLAEGYCLRSSCIETRRLAATNDRGPLTDIWWDIHRLKHNTRRVDHPCQLPPQLAYRLIEIYTRPGEMVLDCFNGAGTTTLTAHQLGRRYIGIELEPKYHQLAADRHREIELGLNPFRKEDRELTAKNSPVARMKKQRYEVPKKTLQLEVRRVANLLGRLPNRDEMIEYGKYPIRYYDEYFVSWGEVCAAARNSGMTDYREEDETPSSSYSQLRLLENRTPLKPPHTNGTDE